MMRSQLAIRRCAVDLDALNKISGEAKELDHQRNMIVSARALVKSTGSDRESIIKQLMTRNCNLNNYGSDLQARHKIVHEMLSEFMESVREDLLASIDSRLAAQEKQFLMHAAAKRLLITASIVGKPADTDGASNE